MRYTKSKKVKKDGFSKSLSLAIAIALSTTNLYGAEPVISNSVATPEVQINLKQSNANDPVKELPRQSNVPDSPLSIPKVEIPKNISQEKIKNEVRDKKEYSFDEALELLRPDIASAVIVKKISANDLRKLVELNIEVGIAVLNGTVVLFTSGNNDEIRLLPAAKELLDKASVIAHTHPKGHNPMPSVDDFLMAGTKTEFVVGEKGVYAYNHNGLTVNEPLSYGYLAGKINSARKPGASTKQTRDQLNEFIKLMDEYNQMKDQSVLYRSAAVSITPTAETSTLESPHFTITGIPGTCCQLDLGSLYSSTNKTTVPRGLRLDYNTGSGGFVGTGNLYNALNFAQLGQMTFGLQGTSSRIKFELMDMNGVKAYIYLDGVDGNVEKVWTVTASAFTGSSLDLTRIKTIYFIVEDAPYKTGSLTIYQKPAVLPSTTNSINDVTDFGYARYITVNNASMSDTLTQPNLGNWKLTYSTSSVAGFAGGGFNYDDQYTSNIETRDFDTQPTNIGLRGPTSSVKVEMKDINGRVVTFQIYGIKTDEDLVWRLPKTELKKTGIDLTKIQYILFIVEGSNQQGTLQIVSRNGLLGIKSNDSLTSGDITNFPNPVQYLYSIAGSGASVSGITQTSRGITFNYQTSSSNINTWAGAGISFDNAGTLTKESVDLSGYQNFILGISGYQTYPNSTTLGPSTSGKIEFKDVNGNVTNIRVGPITTSEKVWDIQKSWLQSKNSLVDFSKITNVSFIVEGVSSQISGSINFNFIPVNVSPSLDTIAITYLPASSPTGLLVGSITPILRTALLGAGSVTEAQRGMILNYGTNNIGWAGASFTYDNFGTGTIESGNLSNYSRLVFGLKGTASDVKFEVVDEFDHKASIKLTGVSSTVEKTFSISVETLKSYGIDMSRVRALNFIVEGLNQSSAGSLEINRIPTAMGVSSYGTNTSAITLLPNSPPSTAKVTGGTLTGTSRGFRVNYNYITSLNPSIGSYTWDISSTKDVMESANLNSYSSLRFGIKGTVSTMTLQVKDDRGVTATLQITGVQSGTEQIYEISTSILRNYGIDLSRTVSISFGVYGTYSSPGFFEVNRLP